MKLVTASQYVALQNELTSLCNKRIRHYAQLLLLVTVTSDTIK